MADIEAVYEDGVFKPQGPVDLQDKTKVRLVVEPVSASEGAQPDSDPTGWKTADELIGCIKEGARGPVGREHDKYLYGAE